MLPIYLALIESEEDKNKFEQIYTTYRKLMFYVANKILRDEQLAEDAVHSSFLKIIQNFDKIVEIDGHKTKSYVVITVRNESINLYRSRRRKGELSLDQMEDTFMQPFSLPQEDSGELIKAISELPVIHRDILKLKYIMNYSNEEIGSMLDISEDAVRKRLERARNKLKGILEKESTSNVL
ncbi:RNA polymerase sigma factor [Clostridium minihomine]|uniref:RNA polymerase sigma factor n=1 Tax=Clostridium minihomine TaxID=2045012 RepID=UPI000C78E38C|nr:RNA polymerase sigma factor [Clostridium minihomine]